MASPQGAPATSGGGRREWVYKTTAVKRYGLTRHQIELAVERGLVRAREVRNPHRGGGAALLVNVADVEANLEAIRALPKYSEEELEARRVYHMRRRLRDQLEFYCPRCGRPVRAPRGSLAFEDAFSGQLPPERAKVLLMIAHYRHVHTEYEAELRRLSEERYRELRDEGLGYEEAWERWRRS